MDDFLKCPKCEITKNGTNIGVCSECNEKFCQECAKRSWFYEPKCPACGSTVVKIIGKINT